MLTKLPGGRDDKEEESTAGKERERRPQRRTIPPNPPHPTPTTPGHSLVSPCLGLWLGAGAGGLHRKVWRRKTKPQRPKLARRCGRETLCGCSCALT